MLYLKEQDGNLNVICIIFVPFENRIFDLRIWDKFVNLKSSALSMYCLKF